MAGQMNWQMSWYGAIAIMSRLPAPQKKIAGNLSGDRLVSSFLYRKKQQSSLA
ncbi:hypothetical protein ACQ4M4_03510 [Leptolyngbya sp. AN02str]|uniref:hypothetical protein n=1 Tax=Leptolyngbya sp. AN02str TaxID=3423363 RepID=UPI003D31A574